MSSYYDDSAGQSTNSSKWNNDNDINNKLNNIKKNTGSSTNNNNKSTTNDDIKTEEADSNKKPNDSGKKSLLIIILIVLAIVIVVGAIFFILAGLFYLGVFGGSSLPTTCVAQSGFICSNPTFNGATISVTLGQITGSTYYNATAVFLNSTELETYSGQTPFPTSAPQSIIIGTMYAGSISTINLPAWYNNVKAPIGSGISGQIWISYSKTPGGQLNYAEVGTFTGKAT